ncbi:MAG: LysM peptidoglycan-binding domain-containing protein [Desulfobacteraceae bacterium]|nr:LysM peptidoglycan-binding domain-containing protein [Desulfobacteraceae bacterium]
MNAYAIARLKKYFIPVIISIFAAVGTAGFAHADIEDHIIKTEAGFYYTVQKGDTLWDLSEKFSDSPWQWPDLWHYNPEISNPHLIYPGQRIRIYKKSFYGEKKSEPEPEKETKEPEKKYFTFSKINSVGFIRDHEVKSWGTLFESMGDKTFISTDDRIYIRPEAGSSIAPGDAFFLYRTISPVRAPETNKRIGVQHILTGVVEILELRENLVIGRIMATFREIEEGDKLMPFMHRKKKFELKPGVKGTEGKIIKSEDGWKILGEQIIAFIDKGSNHGVEIGQQYHILYPVMEEKGLRSRAGQTKRLEFQEMGSLVVLHTEDKTATVLITESKQDLSAGMPIQAMR